MSKRVNIYKPELSHSIINKKRVTKIVNRKGIFIEERAVMDRTLEQYEVNELNAILQSGVYMEAVKEEAPKKPRRTNKQIEEDNKQK